MCGKRTRWRRFLPRFSADGRPAQGRRPMDRPPRAPFGARRRIVPIPRIRRSGVTPGGNRIARNEREMSTPSSGLVCSPLCGSDISATEVIKLQLTRLVDEVPRWLAARIKYDGYRMEARIGVRDIKLLTRAGLGTHRYRRTIEPLGSLKVKSAYGDGELCALNCAGCRSSMCRSAHHGSSPPARPWCTA
jgi:hypothetical protein